MRCHKLWWHYAWSQDRAELPSGELGIGKNHLSRCVPLIGLTPWPTSGPPEVPEKAGLWGRGLSKAQLGLALTGEGRKSLLEKLGPNCIALGLPLACLTTCRSEFQKLLGAWDNLGGGFSCSATFSTAGCGSERQ